MTLVRDVLLLLNALPDVAARDADEILHFETELANVSEAVLSANLLKYANEVYVSEQSSQGQELVAALRLLLLLF